MYLILNTLGAASKNVIPNNAPKTPTGDRSQGHGSRSNLTSNLLPHIPDIKLTDSVEVPTGSQELPRIGSSIEANLPDSMQALAGSQELPNSG